MNPVLQKTIDFPDHLNPLILITTILIVATLLYTLSRLAIPKPLPSIPHDPHAANTLSGDLASLQKDPDGLAKWCSKHLTKLNSPICQIRLGPFTNPTLLIADSPATRDALQRTTHFDRSSYITTRFPLFGGSQIRMPTDEKWRTSRAWLKDLLTPQYTGAVTAPSIHASVERLLEVWAVKAGFFGEEMREEKEEGKEGGRPFCIKEDLKCLALDVMCLFHHGEQGLRARGEELALERHGEYVRGLPRGSREVEIGRHGEATFPRGPVSAFGEGVVRIGDRMAEIYAESWAPGWASWWCRVGVPRYRRYFRDKERFIRGRFGEAVERFRSGGGNGGDGEARNAIELMVEREGRAAEKVGRRPLFEEQIMADEAFSNHLAGLHTTSAAMTWILKYITQYPHVQCTLFHELQAAFPAARASHRLPTSSELSSAKLPYLDAVIEETMRLRAAFIIARDAVQDTSLLGYHIPKNTVCLLVCQGVEHLAPSYSSTSTTTKSTPHHHNPNPNPHFHSDLSTFDPSRWLVHSPDPANTNKPPKSTPPHLAFGLGIRACWGRKIAELEMRMMTAMVVWRFELLDAGAELSGHEAGYDFSYRAKKGFLRLRERD